MSAAILDRDGIFKAMPLSWMVKTFDGKRSVAIAIKYRILAQLVDSDWVDWSDYDEVHVYGDHFVVKKDGSPNIVTVEQLRDSIGWDGSLRRIANEPPPSGVVVQVTVKPDTYNGVTRYKVAWVNPADHDPSGSVGGADAATVETLDAQFGSLLRAAAAGKKPAQKPAPAGTRTPPMPKDNIPF